MLETHHGTLLKLKSSQQSLNKFLDDDWNVKKHCPNYSLLLRQSEHPAFFEKNQSHNGRMFTFFVPPKNMKDINTKKNRKKNKNKNKKNTPSQTNHTHTNTPIFTMFFEKITKRVWIHRWGVRHRNVGEKTWNPSANGAWPSWILWKWRLGGLWGEDFEQKKSRIF